LKRLARRILRFKRHSRPSFAQCCVPVHSDPASSVLLLSRIYVEFAALVIRERPLYSHKEGRRSRVRRNHETCGATYQINIPSSSPIYLSYICQ